MLYPAGIFLDEYFGKKCEYYKRIKIANNCTDRKAEWRIT